MSNNQPTSNQTNLGRGGQPDPNLTPIGEIVKQPFDSDINSLTKQGYIKENDSSFIKKETYKDVIRKQELGTSVIKAIQRGQYTKIKDNFDRLYGSKGYKVEIIGRSLVAYKERDFISEKIEIKDNQKVVSKFGKDNRIDDKVIFDSKGRILTDYDYDSKGEDIRRTIFDYEKGTKEIKKYNDGKTDEKQIFKLVNDDYKLIFERDYEKGRTREFDPITGKKISEKDRVTAEERAAANKPKTAEELRLERGARTEELQSAGLTRSEAAEIALREQKGQTITSVRQNTAEKVVSGILGGSIKTTAFKSEELVGALDKDLVVKQKDTGLELVRVPKIEQAKRAKEIGEVLRAETSLSDAEAKSQANKLAQTGVSADRIKTDLRIEQAKIKTEAAEIESTKRFYDVKSQVLFPDEIGKKSFLSSVKPDESIITLSKLKELSINKKKQEILNKQDTFTRGLLDTADSFIVSPIRGAGKAMSESVKSIQRQKELEKGLVSLTAGIVTGNKNLVNKEKIEKDILKSQTELKRVISDPDIKKFVAFTGAAGVTAGLSGTAIGKASEKVLIGGSALLTGYKGSETVSNLIKGNKREAGAAFGEALFFATPLVLKGVSDIKKVKQVSSLTDRKIISEINVKQSSKLVEVKTKGGQFDIKSKGGEFDIRPNIPKPKVETKTTFDFKEKVGGRLSTTKLTIKGDKIVETRLIGKKTFTKTGTLTGSDPLATEILATAKVKTVKVSPDKSIIRQDIKTKDILRVNQKINDKTLTGDLSRIQSTSKKDVAGLYKLSEEKSFLLKVDGKTKGFLPESKTTEFGLGKLKIGKGTNKINERVVTTLTKKDDLTISGFKLVKELPTTSVRSFTVTKGSLSLEKQPSFIKSLFPKGKRGSLFLRTKPSVVTTVSSITAAPIVTSPILTSFASPITSSAGILAAGFLSTKAFTSKTSKVTPSPSFSFSKSNEILINVDNRLTNKPFNFISEPKPNDFKDKLKIELDNKFKSSSIISTSITKERKLEPKEETITEPDIRIQPELEPPIQEEKTLIKSVISSSFNRNKPPEIPLIPFFLVSGSKTKSVSSQGYVAEVKSKGKFFTPEKKVLSKKDALALGSFYVDNTASAQFRLKKVKGTPKPLGESIAAFNSRKYRTPKRGGSSYIEKNEFRIDTPGELKGITAKGLAKQRAKKFSNSLFGGLNL